MFAVYKYLTLSFLLFAASDIFAQAPRPLLSAASQAKDLAFPAEAYGISLLTPPRMALYQPEGAGSLPRVGVTSPVWRSGGRRKAECVDA